MFSNAYAKQGAENSVTTEQSRRPATCLPLMREVDSLLGEDGGLAMGALPVAESSDLSNGQRSARNELALPSEASAGHRNPECKVSIQDYPSVSCAASSPDKGSRSPAVVLCRAVACCRRECAIICGGSNQSPYEFYRNSLCDNRTVPLARNKGGKVKCKKDSHGGCQQ